MPSVVMNVFTSIYIVVDGFFVARFVGKTEFAAVSIIMSALNILGTVGYMFGVGGSALIAKTLGEKKPEGANRLFSLLVLVSSGIGFFLMVPGFIFMHPFAAMMGAEGRLLECCVLYGRIFILALPAWILSYAFQLFFVTAEKPGLGLAVTVSAGLCNALLDALFIVGFHFGLAGAAAASALSQVVGGVFPLIYFSRKNGSLLKLVKPEWDGRSLAKCCVLMYVSLIFSAMFVGYSNGTGPVISFHYGAGNHDELKNLRKRSLMIIGLASIAMTVLSEAFASPVSELFFRGEERLVQDTIHAFRVFSVSYLFMGIGIFSSSFFTALNNGEISALVSFLRTFVFDLGAVLLLPGLFGVDGIWCAVVFAELMAAVVGCIFMAGLQKKYKY